MRSLIFTLLVLLCLNARSQTIERQVIAGGGAELVQPGCRIGFTLGEMAVATLSNNQLVLTQGFQQPVSAALTGVLPVQLLYFTGILKEGETQLAWKTAQEYNTAHFEVERSANGSQFTKLATVSSKGNSNVPTLYESVDPAPYAPFTYYRLRIVDKDLKFVYSPIVMIRQEMAAGFSLFPNPATNYVALSVNTTQKSTDTWQITALNGQQVATRQVVLQKGLNTIHWPIQHLPQGTYIIRSSQQVFPALKFIKQ